VPFLRLNCAVHRAAASTAPLGALDAHETGRHHQEPGGTLGYAASAWILGRSLLRPPTVWVAAFLVGWAILRLVALVPIRGGLVWFAAVVFGLGILEWLSGGRPCHSG
jgi:hypothetical protein